MYRTATGYGPAPSGWTVNVLISPSGEDPDLFLLHPSIFSISRASLVPLQRYQQSRRRQGERALRPQPLLLFRLRLGAVAVATAVQAAHERRRQALDRAAASGDQHVRHDVELALRQGVGHGDRSRRPGAQALDLRPVALRLGEAQRLDRRRVAETDRAPARAFGLAREAHERGLAAGLRLAGAGTGAVDVHGHLRLGELRLHLGRAARLLQVDAHGLRVLLLLEGRLLLVGDLAPREHVDQLLRERDVLDVDAAGLDLVRGQIARDGRERGRLHLIARLDEAHRLQALQGVAEVVAHGGLQHLVDEVLHRTDHRDDLRRLRVRHVDLNLEVDLEHEAFAALALDRAQLRVQVVRDGVRLRPVQGEDERRHLLGRVDARVQRVLPGAQRLAPDAAVARLHDRPELEVRARCVQRGQAHVALDDRDLALVHDQHRRELHAHEEGVEQVRAVEQRVVLQADAAAAVQEGLEVLVVVVQLVLLAQQRLDELGVGHARLRFERVDVSESADAAGDVRGWQRLALERGDEADHVLVAVRR